MRMSEVRVGMRFKNENGDTLIVYGPCSGGGFVFSFGEPKEVSPGRYISGGTHLGMDSGEVAPWLRLVDE